jgi:hypothetical protein
MWEQSAKKMSTQMAAGRAGLNVYKAMQAGEQEAKVRRCSFTPG